MLIVELLNKYLIFQISILSFISCMCTGFFFFFFWQVMLIFENKIKGCGMGTLFVLVSPCFRENVVATCKIGSVLCSLDNLLQENVIVFFFGN